MGGESSSHEDARAYGVEVFSVAPKPGGPVVWVGLALYLYAITPVVGFHWSVGGDADLLDAGDGVESFFDGSIESFNLGRGVAGCLRVEMDDVPVRRVELEIDVRELIQALDKHARSDQQH